MHDPERARPRRDPVTPSPDLTTDASSRTAWGLAAGLLVVVHLAVVRLARFPEWDGAVFLSRSGGFEGLGGPPNALVASREIGTPVLLGLLRSVNTTLANTRVLWMLLAFAVLVFALRRLGALLDVPAPVAAVVLGTYWLSIEFASSFLSFFLAAAVMLAASAWYLDLRRTSAGQVARGLGLGAAVSACLWLRQVEGALFVGMLGVHSLVAGPRLVWQGRRRGVLVATGTATVLFVIPWAIDSTVRFGSVGARIDAARSQGFDRGLGINLGDYLGILRGDSHLYGDVVTPPDWALTLVTVLLVAVVGAGLACAVALAARTRRAHDGPGEPLAGLALLWLVGLGFIGFFVVYINHVSDKYMVIGGLFLLLAAAATTWRFVASGPGARPAVRAGRRPPVLGGLVALVVLWAVPNAVVANSYEVARFRAGRVWQQNAAVVRTLAGTQDCFGVSRYRAPLAQFATRCRVVSAQDPSEVVAAFDQRDRDVGPDDSRFVLWPARTVDQLQQMLGTEFRSVPVASRAGGTQWVLLYRNGTDA